MDGRTRLHSLAMIPPPVRPDLRFQATNPFLEKLAKGLAGWLAGTGREILEPGPAWWWRMDRIGSIRADWWIDRRQDKTELADRVSVSPSVSQVSQLALPINLFLIYPFWFWRKHSVHSPMYVCVRWILMKRADYAGVIFTYLVQYYFLFVLWPNFRVFLVLATK